MDLQKFKTAEIGTLFTIAWPICNRSGQVVEFGIVIVQKIAEDLSNGNLCYQIHGSDQFLCWTDLTWLAVGNFITTRFDAQITSETPKPEALNKENAQLFGLKYKERFGQEFPKLINPVSDEKEKQDAKEKFEHWLNYYSFNGFFGLISLRRFKVCPKVLAEYQAKVPKIKTADDIWAELRAGTKERVEQIMFQALELKGKSPNIESVDLIAKALGYTVDINDQGETIYYQN